jgi:hypothetical protein
VKEVKCSYIVEINCKQLCRGPEEKIKNKLQLSVLTKLCASLRQCSVTGCY